MVSLLIARMAPPPEVNLKAALALHDTNAGVCLEKLARSFSKITNYDGKTHAETSAAKSTSFAFFDVIQEIPSVASTPCS